MDKNNDQKYYHPPSIEQQYYDLMQAYTKNVRLLMKYKRIVRFIAFESSIPQNIKHDLRELMEDGGT